MSCIKPSRELLSAVFGKTIGEVYINGNEVELYYDSKNGIVRNLINIDTLQRLMKEWAWNQGYDIETSKHYVGMEDDKSNLVWHSNEITSETDAVTKACEWIKDK